MKNIIKSWVCLLLLTLLVEGCKYTSRDKYENKLKNCINDRILKIVNEENRYFSKNKLKTVSSLEFNFFDTIQKFENSLRTQKILMSNTKEGYNRLLKKLEKRYSYKSKKYLNLKKSNGFLFYCNHNFGVYTIMYDDCPLSILSETKSKELFKIKKAYEAIISNGKPKPSLIKKLVLIPGFKKNKVLRLSVCNLIFLYMEGNYGSSNKSHPILKEKNGLFYPKDSVPD